jgi:DHA2 family multidrug resistance protein
MSDAKPIDPGALPTKTKFLIFGVMAFGQFMALIDIQIVAASLNDVQAGLSAGTRRDQLGADRLSDGRAGDDPVRGVPGPALSTRWLFALSAGLFTISSALCGMAWDIDSMILFRVLQGFTGGAMVPTVFATGFAMFSGPQRAMIPAILGMVSVLAPTLGPTVGGWLTEAVGWRSIFYINIIPGALVTLLAINVIKVDRPKLSMLKTIDYSHLAAMAVFLGGLEYVLEEGPRKQWFEDPASPSPPGCRSWPSPCSSSARSGRAGRSSAVAVPQADLRLRLRVQPGDRLRPLFLNLSDPGVPGPGARL